MNRSAAGAGPIFASVNVYTTSLQVTRDVKQYSHSIGQQAGSHWLHLAAPCRPGRKRGEDSALVVELGTQA